MKRWSRPRVAAGFGVAALLVQAAVLLELLTGRPQTLLPITATFGGRRLDLTTIDLGFAALALFLLMTIALAPRLARDRVLDGPGRAFEAVIVAPVIVFLVACLNGVTEVAALVPIYALASGAAALVALEPVGAIPSPRRRMSLAAAIGIVPWGVIAFTQVGSLIVGEGVSSMVSGLTLAMLAAAIGRFVLEWRMRRGGVDLTTALLVTSVASYSVFGWFVVGGVVSGSLLAP